MIFTCLTVQLASCLRASLWQNSSHPGTSTRLCLRWGKGLMAREIKAPSRRMAQNARWKTFMKSYGRWWQWVSARARDLLRQSRPLGNPARKLASGNTVSANEWCRRGSACCLPASPLPATTAPLPASGTIQVGPHTSLWGGLHRALKGLRSLGGKRGEGLQQRSCVMGYRDSPIRIRGAGQCFSHTRESPGPMSRQSCQHGLADTCWLPPGAE